MAAILKQEEILSIVEEIDLVSAMEEGFIEYSNGNTVIPPIGELLFENPEGDAHIKYGYIKSDDYYCVKIASGFYNNPELGISSSQGVMLLFSQQTGQLKAVLLDNGKLTDIRTAAAGSVAAKYFAPGKITGIGIIGTGTQARLQLAHLRKNIDCDTVWIWGRNRDKAGEIKKELASEAEVRVASAPSEVAKRCNLIVTATSARKPLLFPEDIRPGTHITAVGSDTAEKQELAGGILAKADRIIADSIPQSQSRGEIFKARNDGIIKPAQVTELGRAIQEKSLQRTDDRQVTIVDLTGVAVQDIMIAGAVYTRYLNT